MQKKKKRQKGHEKIQNNINESGEIVRLDQHGVCAAMLRYVWMCA